MWKQRLLRKWTAPKKTEVANRVGRDPKIEDSMDGLIYYEAWLCFQFVVSVLAGGFGWDDLADLLEFVGGFGLKVAWLGMIGGWDFDVGVWVRGLEVGLGWW